MDRAELEAKKNNIFNLLEFTIRNPSRSTKRDYIVETLIGNIKEQSSLYGPEHWSIEHHGTDESSIFYASAEKESTLQGFRKVLKNSKFDHIYIKVPTKKKTLGKDNTVVTEANESRIKVHVNTEDKDGKKFFKAQYQDLGNLSFVIEKDENKEDILLDLVDMVMDKVETMVFTEEVTLKTKSGVSTSDNFKVKSFKEENGYQAYIQGQDYVPSGKFYKKVDDLIEKEIKPWISSKYPEIPISSITKS